MARRDSDRSVSRQEIVQATVAALASHQLTDWTVDSVAAKVGCAKGLVLYYFKTKKDLLQVASERIRDAHVATRVEALRGGRGTEALDRLWEALVKEIRPGSFGLWVSLVGHPVTRKSAARSVTQDRTIGEASATALGLPMDAAILAAIPSALDGFALDLLQGRAPDDVRERYDTFWLGILSDGAEGG